MLLRVYGLCSVNGRSIANNTVLLLMAKSVGRRCRTASKYVYYALQLYSSGLSLRNTSKRLLPFIKRNHVSIWNWIQRYKPRRIFQSRRTISEFIIDETLIKAGSDYVWLWVAIEPTDKLILGIRISIEREVASR